jgi:hypothetical protein
MTEQMTQEAYDKTIDSITAVLSDFDASDAARAQAMASLTTVTDAWAAAANKAFDDRTAVFTTLSQQLAAVSSAIPSDDDTGVIAEQLNDAARAVTTVLGIMRG